VCVVGNIIEQVLLHETVHSQVINLTTAIANGKPDLYSGSSTISLTENANSAYAWLHFPAF